MVSEDRVPKIPLDYLAGYFDARGAIYPTKCHTAYPQLRVMLYTTTGASVINGIHEALGLGSVSGPRLAPGTKRERWSFIVSKRDEIAKFLRVLDGRCIVKATLIQVSLLFVEQQRTIERLKDIRKSLNGEDAMLEQMIRTEVRRLLELCEQLQTINSGSEPSITSAGSLSASSV